MASIMDDKTRKFRRIKVSNLAKLNDTGCSVLNVSKDGMMLAADLDAPGSLVHIQLKINGKWLDLAASVVWAMKMPNTKLERMGVCITEAPPEYSEFIENLYLEADEKKS